ncbi:MAG: 16S rRNA (guanine(527)-N(7))-methyltransferase RsmG [Deltaproteobacteria bacterium]|nr:16S rRNA (guanine(527)-N(7))-methyltransferase RsmG [Deltaproteobacteria bacterium]
MQNGTDNTDVTKPIRIPIEDVLDLHTFLPKEIPSLLNEYLNACLDTGIYSVRIIHGKGKGQLKNRVQGLLEKHGARAMNMPLTQSQIDQFAIHARELVEWNRSVNLTAIIDPVEVAVKHFLDTLPVSPLLPSGSWVLDIGSGGGFPGIPLKVMRPDLHVMLIDATRKKVSFQKHIISTLALEDIEARHVRAEDLKRELQPESRRYDIIVSKAVSKLDMFVDLAVPLLRRPGTVIAMKGKSVEAELEAVRSRVEADGLSLVTKKYRLPYLDIERSLIVLSDTPDVIAEGGTS